jgi:hypothetical protein
LAIVSCPHAGFGCSWVGIREDLQLRSDLPDHLPSQTHHYHLTTCPYEALRGFFELHATQNSSLRAENTALREEICVLRSGLCELASEVKAAKLALGPWFRSEVRQQQQNEEQNEQSYNFLSNNSAPLSTGLLPQPTPERIPGRRRLSSPFTSGVLGFPDAPREVEDSQNAQGSASIGSDMYPQPSSPPPSIDFSSPGPNPGFRNANGGPGSPTLNIPPNPLPTLLIHDFPRHSQAPVPPIDTSNSLVGSLEGLRGSVVRVAGEVEGVGRRLDMQFTTEMLRMHEEVAGLRATVHGLRMQVRVIFHLYSAV